MYSVHSDDIFCFYYFPIFPILLNVMLFLDIVDVEPKREFCKKVIYGYL